MTTIREKLGRIPGIYILAYIRRVDAAGGWKKYEQAHRKRLTTTFTRVLFPRLPVDAISHMVDFAFHVGFY